MEILNSPSHKPTRIERWDPEQRLLLVETSETLNPELKEVDISITSGRIVVEGTDERASKLITRLFVSAGSEAEAKRYLEARENEVLNVKKG